MESTEPQLEPRLALECLPLEYQILLLKLIKLGYKHPDEEDPEIKNRHDRPDRNLVAIRYHGMGHSQVIWCDPTLEFEDPDRFYLSVVGGSDAHLESLNMEEFNQPKERLFTLAQVYQLAEMTTDESPHVRLEDQFP